jgi:hypothetical protein
VATVPQEDPRGDRVSEGRASMVAEGEMRSTAHKNVRRRNTEASFVHTTNVAA